MTAKNIAKSQIGTQRACLGSSDDADAPSYPVAEITLWKVRLRGDEAFKRAGWTLRFALVCRALAWLSAPWLPYMVMRLFVG